MTPQPTDEKLTHLIADAIEQARGCPLTGVPLTYAGVTVRVCRGDNAGDVQRRYLDAKNAVVAPVAPEADDASRAEQAIIDDADGGEGNPELTVCRLAAQVRVRDERANLLDEEIDRLRTELIKIRRLSASGNASVAQIARDAINIASDSLAIDRRKEATP